MINDIKNVAHKPISCIINFCTIVITVNTVKAFADVLNKLEYLSFSGILDAPYKPNPPITPPLAINILYS